MKFLFFLLPLFLSFETLKAQVDYDRQIENFTKEVTKKIDTSKHSKIGIMEFINNDKTVNQLGEIIADDLSAELANYSNNSINFEILERTRLDQIFKEKKLIKNYDSKDARELGKINAVDILIIGTIIPFGDYYKLTIKLLDAKTGNILSSVKGQLAKTKALDELYSKKNNSKESNQPIKVEDQENRVKNENGILTIENRTNQFLVVFISSEQAVQTLKATKWEEITIPKNSSESIPSLKAGTYYCCAVISRYDNACMISKKFDMTVGNNTKIILQL